MDLIVSHKRNLCGVWKAYPTLALGSQRFPRITRSSPTSLARSHHREVFLPLHLDMASRLRQWFAERESAIGGSDGQSFILSLNRAADVKPERLFPGT